MASRPAQIVLWVHCERCARAHDSPMPPRITGSDATFRVPESDAEQPKPLVTCPRCGSTDVWIRWASTDGD